MANPDDDKTIINVKGVPKSAWEAAKRLAAQANEPMGLVLARAIRCLEDQEAGRVKPAGKAPLTPEQAIATVHALAEYQASLAAMKQAGAPRVQSLLTTAQAALAQLIEPLAPGKPAGKQSQERAFKRQPVTISGGFAHGILSTELPDNSGENAAH